MAKRKDPVLRQRVFEARYDQGYRYLDRCGEAMLTLESLLVDQTKRVWLPSEMVPTGARIECPDLDLYVVFNTYTMIVDQNPVGEIECEFDDIALTVLSTLVGRFDIRTMRRLGARRIKILADESDSVDGADELSVRFSPLRDWRSDPAEGLEPRTCSIASAFESQNRTRGIRIVTKPFAKVGADVKVDERLKGPPHLLHEKQREALVDKLKRAKQRQHDPEAGLLIDIDYYWVWPPKEASVRDFLTRAWQEADRLEKDFLSSGGRK